MVDGHSRPTRIGVVSRMLAAALPAKALPQDLLDAIAASRETIMRQRRERADVFYPEAITAAVQQEMAGHIAKLQETSAAEVPEETPVPPDGVLGYAVAVFPGGGPHCTGLTHTGLMTLDSARREAAGHAAAARNEPSTPYHAGCEYRTVEIREVPQCPA